MGNLANALQQLRAERREAQSHVEKLDKAIAVIESLNVTGASRITNQPTGTKSAPIRVISAASRRRMARAQKARWAKVKKESKPVLVGVAKTAGAAPVAKHTMSASAKRKISAFQRARWAKLRAGQKKAA